MRFLSLCSGIEAASVAWAPMGWRAAAVAEIEAFPSAVLAHHYPDVPNLGDITKFKEWPDLGAIDLICGGTPCQSFSIAGLRKGLADPRGNLSLTFLAIVDRYRPRYVIWENVPGVLSDDGGRSFASIVGGLGQLGYGWAYRVLDAQYVRVDGLGRAVPQRRRRVIVVGYLGDWRRAAAVLSEPESVLGNTPPRREAREGVARPIGAGSSRGSGYRNDADTAENLVGYGGGNCSGPIEVAASLAAHGVRQDFEVETFVAQPLLAKANSSHDDSKETYIATRAVAAIAIQERAISENPDAGPDGVGVRQDGAAYTLARQVPQAVAFDMRGREGGAQFEVPSETANIRAASGGSSKSYVAQAVADPLTAVFHKHHGASGGKDSLPRNHIVSNWAVRRLTPTECERLQGFPDGYTDVPYRGKPAADGPRYKALGNSWAVNVFRWVGRRIEMVEQIAAELDKEDAA